jgi:hypothetical protein
MDNQTQNQAPNSYPAPTQSLTPEQYQYYVQLYNQYYQAQIANQPPEIQAYIYQQYYGQYYPQYAYAQPVQASPQDVVAAQYQASNAYAPQPASIQPVAAQSYQPSYQPQVWQHAVPETYSATPSLSVPESHVQTFASNVLLEQPKPRKSKLAFIGLSFAALIIIVAAVWIGPSITFERTSVANAAPSPLAFSELVKAELKTEEGGAATGVTKKKATTTKDAPASDDAATGDAQTPATGGATDGATPAPAASGTGTPAAAGPKYCKTTATPDQVCQAALSVVDDQTDSNPFLSPVYG